MEVRSPLTLLVCGTSNDQSAAFLKELGAQAFFVPSNCALALLRGSESLLAVDAVVVDATSIAYLDAMILPLGEEPLRAADMLVREILKLPPTVRMRNGIPCNGLPIIVLVDDHHYHVFTAQYPGDAPSVTVCKVPFRPNGSVDPYELPYGWEKIYSVIARRVQEWTFALVERMRSLGWSLTVTRGIGRKYDSAKSDFDMESLAPSSTRLEERSGNGQIVGRITLVQWDHRIVGKMFGEFSESIKYERHMREYWFQRLFSENPYLLGAASFELVPHPHFVPVRGDTRFPRTQIPDFILRRVFQGTALRAIEIKRPDTPPSTLGKGVRQVLQAAKFIDDPGYKETPQIAGFGRFPHAVRPLVIAGLSTRPAFEAHRRQQTAAEVLGYDEVLDNEVRRYTFVPSAGLSAYIRDTYEPQ
jgi:hypothetical protein